MEKTFVPFAAKYLVAPGTKCYRHCERPTRFVSLIEDESRLVGAYVCPDNYTSRVVYFAKDPNPAWFEDFLREQVGDFRLRHKDIRFATRHGWELGGSAEEEIAKAAPETRNITQYYWTFYPKNEEEKKLGTFLCDKEIGGCGKLFTKSLTEASRLCPACSGS